MVVCTDTIGNQRPRASGNLKLQILEQTELRASYHRPQQLDWQNVGILVIILPELHSFTDSPPRYSPKVRKHLFMFRTRDVCVCRVSALQELLAFSCGL